MPESSPLPPSLEMTAPDGRPIVLRPVLSLQRWGDLGPAALAAVAGLCVIFAVTGLARLNHTDLWGHLNFGRWIVRHGELPHSDPFRSFATGEPFLNVPWLSQVLGYEVYRFAGLEGLVLAHAVLATLTAAALLWAVRGRGVSLGWAVAAAAASYLLALPVTGTIRPQLFGTLGFALTLAAIARLPRRRDPLLWLPLVFALWANLHGSFLLGLAALGCQTAATAWDARGWRWHGLRRRRQFWRAVGAVALATAGACVNPCGPRLLLLVGQFGENSNLADISEWHPLTLASLSGGLCFASLLLMAGFLRWSRRRITAAEILLTLLFLVACLGALRMLAWWALVWPWVVAPHAAYVWSRWRGRPVTQSVAETDGMPRRLLAAGILVALTLWWTPPTHALLCGRPRPDEAILSHGTPVGLAETAARLGLRGRFFAPLDWADYLVWRTDGALEPLVHSHVHLTGPRLWRDFLTLRDGREGWRETARVNHLRYMIVPTMGYSGLNQGLQESGQDFPVHPVFRDGGGKILAIDGSSVADGASSTSEKW